MQSPLGVNMYLPSQLQNKLVFDSEFSFSIWRFVWVSTYQIMLEFELYYSAIYASLHPSLIIILDEFFTILCALEFCVINDSWELS